MRIRISIFLFMMASRAFAFDASYFRSQSTSSQSNKFQIAERFFSDHRIALTYSASKDTSGTLADDSAGYFKFAYRYKFNEDLAFGFDGKSFDDYYNYNGTGFGAKISYRIWKWEIDSESDIFTRIHLRTENQNKTYGKLRNEDITMRSISIGIEQDLPAGFLVGFEGSGINYDSQGAVSKSALANQTTAVADINTYTSYFSKTSNLIYGEYSQDDLSIGISRTSEIAALSSGSNYVSLEYYLDLTLLENYTISFSLTQGRSESSNLPSNTWGFGVSGSF
jgi:hypothetical protein